MKSPSHRHDVASRSLRAPVAPQTPRDTSSPLFRERLRPLPTATVSAVVGEVVRETLAAHEVHWREGESITYLPVARQTSCPATVDCLPLGPLLDVGTEPIGHLHRVLLGTDGKADAVPCSCSLQVIGSLVVANALRDLLDVRLAQAEHDVTNLRIALESNRVIGVAVGVLMVTRRCNADEAFEALRTASQSQNRKLRDVAADVEFAGTIIEGDRAVG